MQRIGHEEKRSIASSQHPDSMAWLNWPKHLQCALKPALILLATLLGLLIAHQLILPIVTFLVPSLDPVFFDLGVYGAYPTNTYSSFDLSNPQARHPRWNPECDTGHVLLTPNGPSVERPGPLMLDGTGDLVWMSDEFESTANFKMQSYQGENYLTFWSGSKAATSGQGVYFMLDSSYQVVRTISGVGDGLFGDLHEFKITDQGTALLTVYNTTNADLRGMGMGRCEHGWIVDSLFQEIDIESGELLFQWSAAAHFDPVETHMTNPIGGYLESIPFDFYHLNSVDKDSQGNYLISSRHYHHVMCISPAGETLWILGGRDNQFEDLSDGQATNFKWQHDARWFSEDEGIITLFDNSKAGPLHADASESRALVIQLDLENRTAKLVRSMTSLQGILASSQGSIQSLPDSQNFFVGWGSAAAYSEYTRNGELLCETHLGASWYYSFERMKSYRTTKVFGWHGTPQTPPQIHIEGDLLSVSWNGATEVDYWALEVATDVQAPAKANDELLRDKDGASVDRFEAGSPQIWESIDIIQKAGFEGVFDLADITKDKNYKIFRVAALDVYHKVLGYSEPCEAGDYGNESSYLMRVFKLALATGILIGACLAFKHVRSNGRVRGYNFASLAWMDWLPESSSGYRSGQQAGLGRYEWIQLKLPGSRRIPR